MSIGIAPSLMCMDLTRFNEQITFLDQKVRYFHIDIMDGHFVQNLTLSPFFVKAVKKLARKPLDCHLMVMKPENFIEALAEAGADMITLQVETISGQAFRLIERIHQLGMKVGIIFNPESDISVAFQYIHKAEKVTVLTIDPGFAGQSFIPEMLEKITALKIYREQHGLHYDIEIDGSCNSHTYEKLIHAGADILIVGTSGLFGLADDISVAWDRMVADIGQYATIYPEGGVR